MQKEIIIQILNWFIVNNSALFGLTGTVVGAAIGFTANCYIAQSNEKMFYTKEFVQAKASRIIELANLLVKINRILNSPLSFDKIREKEGFGKTLEFNTNLNISKDEIQIYLSDEKYKLLESLVDKTSLCFAHMYAYVEANPEDKGEEKRKFDKELCEWNSQYSSVYSELKTFMPKDYTCNK